MPFRTDLILRSIGPTENSGFQGSWAVMAPLVYESRYGVIVVPVDYPTDLASVPRFAWRIVRPDHPTARRAAVVHDYIYTDLTQVFLKRHADQIFYDALLEDGTSKTLAYLMWLAVRVGGKGNWS